MRYGSQKRSVFFNLDKEHERELFQFSDSINFSGWVKEQLAKEVRRRKQAQIKQSVSAEASFQAKLGDA